MSSYDGMQQIQRKERQMELAAIFKEEQEGDINSLNKIIHRFSMQEGVKPETAKEYIHSFKIIGLIVFAKGKKKWKYNPDAEWELFRIDI